MLKWLLSLVMNSLALIAVSGFFPETFHIENVQTALLASFLLSILNVLVKPFLIIITLPVTILSMGLFLLVINGITLFMTSRLIGPAFEIHSVGTAVLAAIFVSILNYALQRVFVKPIGRGKE